jgi:hypothetical protein
MKLTQEQIYWLNECTEGTWTLNEKTGLVDVDGDFISEGEFRPWYPIPEEEGLKNLKGVRFGTVTGAFNCRYNQLTSLEGAPQEVGFGFTCSHNQLTSLEGAPQKVGGYFNCENNKLVSLVGAPQKVGQSFCCSVNKLTSLVGAPQEVGGYFNCPKNQLTSLVGAPQKVGESFDCSHNQLTSLVGAPQKVGQSFCCSYNKLTSIEGAPQNVGWDLRCPYNKISEKTLKMIWEVMVEKNVDYWMALCILKSELESGKYWELLSKGLDENLSKDAQRSIPILSRFGAFKLNKSFF